MRDKRLEKARKAVTTLVVAALVAAVSYAVSGVLLTHSPAFSLTANESFSITSQVYASTCTSTPGAKLEPGVTRCLAVTVHNPLSVAIDVKSLSMTVTSFTHTPSNPQSTPPCTTTMLSPPTLFTSNFVVPAGSTHTIDKPIQLSTTIGTQDACEYGTFHFSYSGTATFTDRTHTSLTASPTTGSATLNVTVTPANASSDPYGPASTTAPVHHVTFYSCGTTATCTSKSSLGSVTLTTSTATTKVATATKDVTVPSTPGTYYYQVSYPAKGTHTGTFTGSSSIISITVTD